MAEEKSGFRLAKDSTEAQKEGFDIGYDGVMSGSVSRPQSAQASQPTQNRRADYVDDTGTQFELKRVLVPMIILLILAFLILEYFSII